MELKNGLIYQAFFRDELENNVGKGYYLNYS